MEGWTACNKTVMKINLKFYNRMQKKINAIILKALFTTHLEKPVIIITTTRKTVSSTY